MARCASRPRLVRLVRDEGGMSLVEMLVAMSLLSVVSVIFLSIMASVQSSVERQADRSGDNDQARLAVEQLDKEIRSGNLLYNPNDPAFLPAGTSPGYGLLIYTQANANIRNPINRCVQWRIVERELQRRDWPPNQPENVSPWRVVAENVVNEQRAVAAFELEDDLDKGNRLINVTILTQGDPDAGRPAQIQVSVSGRNTSYGYPVEVCNQLPPP